MREKILQDTIEKSNTYLLETGKNLPLHNRQRMYTKMGI